LIGAKWSHGGKIYMSDNNGSGVYVLDSIDPAGGTANVFATAIDQTIATNSNDGFSCGVADVPPTPPTAILNVECVIDDFYNVGAEIYGGSLGVNWRLVKSSGELITAGVVPAWTTETPALTEPAQFTEGLVLVLTSLDSGSKLDSESVPAPCFAPVSKALLVLEPECDADVTGSITNDGEATLYGAIYVNDELVLPDTEIQIGQTVDFPIPALDLTAGDEITLLTWDDNDYEDALTVVYPEPCPTTTTVPPTTTTVPPTTTVVIETPTTVPTTTTTVPTTTTTVPETTTTVPDTTTTTPDGGGTVAETPSAEPVEQTPTFTG
jgi:hypothetical protein